MDRTRAALLPLYCAHLLEDILPFWMKHGLDREYGGYTTCIRDDGSLISGDKYLWSQGRGVWTFSALYNRMEATPSLKEEWLDAARLGVRFLLEHGPDQEGRWVYHTDRMGRVIEGAISIYADCFAVYGLTEYFRATQDETMLDTALDIHRQIVQRIQTPDFAAVAPYKLPRGWRVHAIPMILLEVTQELADVAPDPALDRVVEECLRLIMDHHVRPDKKTVLEHLTVGFQELDHPDGGVVVPGHAIESMWFVLHQAQRRGDMELVSRAVEVIRWMLDAGWDKEYGGLFLGIDAYGRTPTFPNYEKKLWWPHTEALYALILAHELTREAWCMEAYWKVHEYAFSHFPDREHGEWHQKLDRRGTVIEDVIALPVKDPFHLPRALILSIQSLSRWA